jgi:hypothetical protein
MKPSRLFGNVLEIDFWIIYIFIPQILKRFKLIIGVLAGGLVIGFLCFVMGNCYSQKQHERQLQAENIENIRPPPPPQPKPRIEESSSYETDSEASLPPPSIQPTVPTVSKRLSEDKIELQKPPPKPKRGIVGKIDDTGFLP